MADSSHDLIFLIQILQRDKSGQEKAPKVIQEELSTTAPKGSRQFSTSARRARKHYSEYKDILPQSDEPPGHIFGLLPSPLPRDAVLKHRYQPIIKQFTNLMMRDGKLSKAQRVRPSVSLIFDLQLPMMCCRCLYANSVCGGRTLL